MKSKKINPYYIADVLDTFSVKLYGSDRQWHDAEVYAGETMYVQRSLTKDQWEVYLDENRTKAATIAEKELLNKIKVRRDDNNKPISSDNLRDLYHDYVKKKFKDLSDQDKMIMKASFVKQVTKYYPILASKAKVQMPDITDINELKLLLQQFYNAKGFNDDFETNTLKYLADIYDDFGDNGWSYINNLKTPSMFKQPFDMFYDWLKEHIRKNEIEQHKNEAQLKIEKRNRKWRQEGVVACPRCGGSGGSDTWKNTGYTCYECNGSGYVDPLSLEDSGRERLGLPRDYHECEEYLEKRKTASSKQTIRISKKLWKSIGDKAGWKNY